MLEAILLWCLATYFWFHVLSRADILNTPRAWVLRTLPNWLTYPLGCVFCFTWWVTLIVNVLGIVEVDLIVLFAAPVVNMALDLIVRALIRANEPPVMGKGKTLTSGDQSITTWTGSTVVAVRAASDMRAGDLVQVVPYGDGVKIPESMRYLAAHNATPDGWEHTNRDSSRYQTSGVVRWWPGKLIGRRVRVKQIGAAEAEGKIVDGEGPPIWVSGISIPPQWHYIVQLTGSLDRLKVRADDCTLLADDAPFNPLDHEQTK